VQWNAGHGMKAKMKPCAMLLMLVLATTSRPQTLASDLSLTIRLQENTVKVGAFVTLEITVKNTSDRESYVGAIVGSAEAGYDVTVVDGEGKAAMETSYGRKIHGKEPKGNLTDLHSERVELLKPGETLQEQIHLSEIYDFTHPGKYTVQVSRRIATNDAHGKNVEKTVKSNSVTLTVTKQ
jgi:hypothetical protein